MNIKVWSREPVTESTNIHRRRHSRVKMSSPRSCLHQHLLLMCLILVLVMKDSSVPALTIPPYSLHRWQYGQRNLFTFLVKRLLKQGLMKRSNVIELNETQVEDSLRENYLYVNNHILNTSVSLHLDDECSQTSDLYENTLTHLGDRWGPPWVSQSPMIGECTTRYTTLELPASPLYSPRKILQAQCPCQNSACSDEGHKCEPLTYLMPVWVLNNTSGEYAEKEKKVTIACVCIIDESREAATSGGAADTT